ncbi:hypothetical protein RR46_03289 [Papilio xuthus]|uniref:Uncharacterized protein n=1 Tax=Papilio xuthus TaxID=66420 RepID=A0A194QGK5_PAPXU|nr:hypothetical protein RR46_03289 [Papilio xuthus]
MADSVLRMQENNAKSVRESEAARALHERLVAYAHFVAGDPESRSGVCSEHSYARVRETGGAGTGAGAEMRELLSAAPPPSPPAPLDVEHVSGCAPPDLSLAPHLDHESDAEEDDDADEEDVWEERVTAQAPSAAHARLAQAAIDVLLAEAARSCDNNPVCVRLRRRARPTDARHRGAARALRRPAPRPPPRAPRAPRAPRDPALAPAPGRSLSGRGTWIA